MPIAQLDINPISPQSTSVVLAKDWRRANPAGEKLWLGVDATRTRAARSQILKHP